MTDTLMSGAVYLVVFIVAGLLWSFSGYLNNLRSHINFQNANPPNTKDPNWNGFDKNAMKDDVFIAFILGTVAFVINGATSIPDITTVQSFLAAVVASYGLVGIFDKIGIGAILNK